MIDNNIDRRVHAEGRYILVVRYDRAGKWFIEDRDGTDRQAVKIDVAAKVAASLERNGVGGKVHYGVPGGSAFDRRVRAALSK